MWELLRCWTNYSDTRLKVSLGQGQTEDTGWTMKAEAAGPWEQAVRPMTRDGDGKRVCNCRGLDTQARFAFRRLN